jgi:hypothetical protein
MTPPSGPRRGVAGWISAIPRELARIPVTLLTVSLLIIVGVVTGTLFAPADPNDAAITSLEFGLPAFREGRVWTLFTGAVTFTEPEFYYFVGAMLAVGLGLYERAVGSLRAATALLVTHSVGIVLPALFLWPFVGSGWTWATTLGTELDAGMSAGGFGVAAAATALLRPPWRGRLRVLGTTFLAVMVIKSGLLWDLEHLSAWVTGLAIGPFLAKARLQARGLIGQDGGEGASGELHRRPPTASEARTLTALIVAGFAVSNVVESLYPGIGGLVGPGIGDVDLRGFPVVILELGISLLIAGALPRPHALPWWVATAGVTGVAVNSLLNTPYAPRSGDTVCSLIVLAVLIWNRNSWPWRSDRTALRPIGLLLVAMAVFTAVTSVAIWAARAEFAPVPDLWQILLEALARFTFTTGQVLAVGVTARGVIALTGAIWGVLVVSWLVWALYLRDGLPAARVGRGRPRPADEPTTR